MVRRLAATYKPGSVPGEHPERSGYDIRQRRGDDCPRGMMFSDLSHDMRTPLNIIIGFTELMLDEVSGGINDEQRQNLTDIRKACDRILNILNVYLDQAGNGKAP